jgi:hypothetical protein
MFDFLTASTRFDKKNSGILIVLFKFSMRVLKFFFYCFCHCSFIFNKKNKTVTIFDQLNNSDSTANSKNLPKNAVPVNIANKNDKTEFETKKTEDSSRKNESIFKNTETETSKASSAKQETNENNIYLQVK